MKRANKTGSITKLKGKRRKPYAIRMSFPIPNTNLTKQKYIAYFKTIKEAQQYLDTLYPLDNIQPISKITFIECIDEALSRLENSVRENTFRAYKDYRNVLQPLWNVEMVNFTGSLYQDFIDTLIKSNYKIKRLSNITIIAKKAVKVALRKGVIQYDPLQAVDLSGAIKTPDRNRKPFSHQELSILWSNKDNDKVKEILILIYTGMRVNEFMSVSIENYDKENKTLSINDSKTKAGIRVIPIHKSILKFVNYFMDKYECLYKPRSYDVFRDNFHTICNELLNNNHIPHETRYTFATLLDESHIDIMVSKILIGHRVSDITKGVYTHENYNRLVEGINKLPTF